MREAPNGSVLAHCGHLFLDMSTFVCFPFAGTCRVSKKSCYSLVITRATLSILFVKMCHCKAYHTALTLMSLVAFLAVPAASPFCTKCYNKERHKVYVKCDYGENIVSERLDFALYQEKKGIPGPLVSCPSYYDDGKPKCSQPTGKRLCTWDNSSTTFEIAGDTDVLNIIYICRLQLTSFEEFNCSMDADDDFCKKYTVNGQWGSWGSYGSCSETCGDGIMTRYRTCDNPAPAYGGAYCVESSSGDATCKLRECPSAKPSSEAPEITKFHEGGKSTGTSTSTQETTIIILAVFLAVFMLSTVILSVIVVILCRKRRQELHKARHDSRTMERLENGETVHLNGQTVPLSRPTAPLITQFNDEQHGHAGEVRVNGDSSASHNPPTEHLADARAADTGTSSDTTKKKVKRTTRTPRPVLGHTVLVLTLICCLNHPSAYGELNTTTLKPITCGVHATTDNATVTCIFPVDVNAEKVAFYLEHEPFPIQRGKQEGVALTCHWVREHVICSGNDDYRLQQDSKDITDVAVIKVSASSASSSQFCCRLILDNGIHAEPCHLSVPSSSDGTTPTIPEWVWVVIGIAAFVIAVLVLVVVIMCICIKQRQNSNSRSPPAPPNSNSPGNKGATFQLITIPKAVSDDEDEETDDHNSEDDVDLGESAGTAQNRNRTVIQSSERAQYFLNQTTTIPSMKLQDLESTLTEIL